MVPNSFRTVENTNLLHSSLLVEFLKLFITDDFVTKMSEQTNFNAVQRGAPRSFEPVSDKVINLYLYTNIRTDSGRRPETIFGCTLCKTHPCSELCFAQFHAKIHNIYRKNKRLIMRWIHCLFDNLSNFANLFHGVIIINVLVITYHWKGQPFFYLIFFLFLIQFRKEVLIFFKAKLLKIRVISLAL